jgi:hypothetical protein
MTSELRWYDPDKILLTTYGEQVTAEDLTTTIEGIIAALDTAKSHVHVIVDWRQTKEYPFFVDLLFPARKLLRHPRLGWIVIVGQSHTVNLWLDLFTGIKADFRYKVFDTLDESAQFLRTVVMP